MMTRTTMPPFIKRALLTLVSPCKNCIQKTSEQNSADKTQNRSARLGFEKDKGKQCGQSGVNAYAIDLFIIPCESNHICGQKSMKEHVNSQICRIAERSVQTSGALMNLRPTSHLSYAVERDDHRHGDSHIEISRPPFAPLFPCLNIEVKRIK